MAAAKMRSDACRNHEAILVAAIAVLAADPQASMHDIAQASGIGRTTLYRHFPDRSALEAAIYHRVLSEADSISSGLLRPETEDPIHDVQELCVALAGLGGRYRFLTQHNASVTATDPESLRHRGARLRAFLRSAQRADKICAEVSADWLLTVLVALMIEASGHAFRDAEQRNATLRATVRRLLAP